MVINQTILTSLVVIRRKTENTMANWKEDNFKDKQWSTLKKNTENTADQLRKRKPIRVSMSYNQITADTKDALCLETNMWSMTIMIKLNLWWLSIKLF
jgi:hypothetical protein